MMELLPIESAPKDGSWVLLYFPEGYWVTDGKFGIGFWGGEGDDENWYACESDSQPMNAFESQPTKWAPLPDI